MSIPTLLSMAAFALVASISPGPVNLVCMSTGTRYNPGSGLKFVSGATTGFIALFLAIGFGLHTILANVPGFAVWLRGAGIVFLLYLSFLLVRDNGRIRETSSGAAPGFITGAAMQWLNPKAWLASASGIGAYIPEPNLQQVLLFALVYAPICWLSLASWVYAGVYLRRQISNPAILRYLNRGLALLLAASCLFLVFG